VNRYESNLGSEYSVVGVGGQGTLVAGKLLGTVARLLGLDVKVSEEHGMSQRGGSVITMCVSVIRSIRR
jgi:indolepyruvate ferredoxin oxidoreductase beta subunit